MKKILLFVLPLLPLPALAQDSATKNSFIAGFRDCDNTIRDKMPGALNRSATDCEQKFDLAVKTTISEAFEKVIFTLSNRHWLMNNSTELKAIEGVDRASQDYFSVLGSFEMQFGIDPASADGQAWYRKLQESYDEISRNASNAGYKPDNERLMKSVYEVNCNTAITISVSINNETVRFTNFTGEQKMIKVPGADYAIQSPYAAARSGGGKDNSMDATILFIGRWKWGKTDTYEDGSSSTIITGYFNKNAPHLSVQNIMVRIEASSSLANTILKELDVQKLISLIQK